MSHQNSVSFDSLGLSAASLRSLAQAGYERPTPIQAQAIPAALTGVDVIGCAATGTGKTAAFVMPILERLHAKQGLRGLVLAPTRELANQIAEQVEKLGGGQALKTATLIGGSPMGAQMRALRGGAQLIVATPGRLIDHLQQGTARLDGVEVLVLDEADRMLDMGFKPQLTKILAKVPQKRQTMLFSATMAGEVATFAKTHLKSPVRVEVARSGTMAARADQKAYAASQPEKTALLLALLAQDEDSTLVFTRTKRRADKVAHSLERAGLEVARIHANRSQNQREAALEGFRDGRYRVLVATDIAARGIDVAAIGHVVNYDLPHVPADYVHRIGRTARAEASGRASSFFAPEENDLLRDIEKFTRTPVPRGVVPRDSEVFQREMKAAQAFPQRPSAPRHSRNFGGQRHGGGGRSGGGRGGGHASSGQSHGHGPKRDAPAPTGAVLFSGGPRRHR